MPLVYSGDRHEIRVVGMAFVRGTWAFIVGVKDLLVLLLLLLFFGLLWAVLHTRAPLSVPSGAALVIDLNGTIVDQASERSPFAFASGVQQPRQIQGRDVIASLKSARTDNRIKAVVLDLDTFLGSGEADLQAIGRELDATRAAGKPVIAYATAYADDGYYLASHATKVWMNPLGGVLLTGPGGPNLYFKAALDKLDVDVNVFRVGTYKSAVEPFTRTESSPEAKAAEQALVDSLWKTYATDVAKARPGVDVNAFLANLPARIGEAGGDFAQAAVKARLVDQLGTRADFGRAMAKLVGAGANSQPGSYNAVKLRTYRDATRTSGSGPAVGIVYISGTIVDGQAPLGSAGGDTISAQIEKAVANDDIKALVVRVDSPGGSVLASERIREALTEARNKGLPVVASFGTVAASGGYWVSTAAQEVFAEASTITGSIGVFAVVPTFNRALKALGIGTDGVKSTPYSGDPDAIRGLTPDTKAILQASVEDVYRRFTGLVARARALPVTRVDEIGQGRVWAGNTARDLKLVDHLGGLDMAVAAAAKRADLPADVRTVDIEKSRYLPFQLLSSVFGSDDNDEGAETDASIRDPFARATRLSRLRMLSSVGEAQAIAAGPTVQVHCLACATVTPPRLEDVTRAEAWLAKAFAVVTGQASR